MCIWTRVAQQQPPHPSRLERETLRSHAAGTGTRMSPLSTGTGSLLTLIVSCFPFWDSGSAPGAAEQGPGDQVELSAGPGAPREQRRARAPGLRRAPEGAAGSAGLRQSPVRDRPESSTAAAGKQQENVSENQRNGSAGLKMFGTCKKAGSMNFLW